ncbi:MAG: phosphoribulokinase [Porticoccaceae bacterium]|nr:phosphoribulokinase [Porticoccaceae bacterium]
MTPILADRLTRFIKSQGLPDDFQDVIDNYYLPLAEWLHQQCSFRPDKAGTDKVRTNKTANGCAVLGISGAQGTGKSTLSAVLKIILEENYHWQTAILSLDDIYLSGADRQNLAHLVHPLLQTRGVPGTHDTTLGIDIIEQLKALKPGQTMRLPRFDKARDDRKPEAEWEAFTGPADLIIFEGWCLSSSVMDNDDLATPINALEAEADKKAVWRNYINQQLENNYGDLFGLIDVLIMLKAPDFDCIRRWRIEQEAKLAASHTSNKNTSNKNTSNKNTSNKASSKIMDEDALIRFIQHYERLTQHNLSEMPDRADVVLSLDKHHQVTDMRYKNIAGL